MGIDTAFHMPGKHNQKDHGKGGSGGPGDLHEFPPESHASHKAILRRANTSEGVKKSSGGGSGPQADARKDRDKQIDDLQAKGYLKQDGDSYHTTDKGKEAIDNATPFEPGQAAGEVESFVIITAAGPPITGTGGEAYQDMTGGTPWDGILAVEGTKTGDGRMFAENAISWADTAGGVVPLRWNIEDSHGGTPTTKAVNVGRISMIWRDPDNPLVIRGKGIFDDGPNSNNEYAAEAARRVGEGFLSGVSIDPDDITDSDVEFVFPQEQAGDDGDIVFMPMPELTIFHAGRIRAATLVDIPAFIEAKIQVSAGEEDAVAAAAHFSSVSDATWNGAQEERRLPQGMSAIQARSAFAHVEQDTSQVSARFLHHHVDEDSAVGVANLTACISGIRLINAGRAPSLSVVERRAAYEHLAQHLRTAGLTPPEFAASDEGLVASFSVLDRPPANWFANPELKQLTSLTVTDEGRVFGHGAAWETCHMGFSDACVTPPAEPGGVHAYYRLGEVVCADGSRVAVGSITLGTGHASVRGISASQAKEHYDNTGTAVALVASGEDEFGIWIAGAIRPGTPENRVVELRGASLSGDWRRIGGSLRLVAFLAVNRPGFPVPRTSMFQSHKQSLSLVASGVVTQTKVNKPSSAGTDAAIARIARSIGRDPETRMMELRHRMGRE